MSAAEGRADEASAKRIAYLGPSSVLATWSSPVAWMVGFAEEGDTAGLMFKGRTMSGSPGSRHALCSRNLTFDPELAKVISGRLCRLKLCAVTARNREHWTGLPFPSTQGPGDKHPCLTVK